MIRKHGHRSQRCTQAGRYLGGRRRFSARLPAIDPLEQRTLLAASFVPQMVKDLNTNPYSSNPGGGYRSSGFLTIGKTTYFAADDGVQVGKTTYFAADDGVHGTELWKTNGTVAGTMLVKDIWPGNGTFYVDGAPYTYIGSSYPTNLTSYKGMLIFSANNGYNGYELWKSDGTAAGTVMIKNIDPQGSSNPSYFTQIGGTLYFEANDGLWKTNGTTAGTVLIKQFVQSYGSTFSLVDLNNTLYFAADDGDDGVQLWKSNGTTAGTVMVADLDPGPAGFYPSHLVADNGKLIFVANDENGLPSLWSSDGTAAGTTEFLDSGVTQGGSMENLTNVNGTVFFELDTPSDGIQLWKTDGTAAGTAMVSTINNSSASSWDDSLNNMTVAGNKLYFTADDGIHGIELWVSDGTPGRTAMIADLNPGSDSSYPHIVDIAGSTVFFTANDGVSGYDSVFFKTDGTTAGTVRVSPIQSGQSGTSGPTVPSFYFDGFDPIHGYELWKSNGATAGTALVKDINPLTAPSNPTMLTNANGTLYFQAQVGTDTAETVFKTDGTAAGTESITNFLDNQGFSGVSFVGAGDGFATLGSSVLFSAPDGNGGQELWETDGTVAGTLLVADFPFTQYPGYSYPGSNSAPLATGTSIQRDNITVNGGGGGGGIFGPPPPPPTSASPISDTTEVGGTLYFLADGGYGVGEQLWKTDGTPQGTALIGPGSLADGYFPFNNQLYYEVSGFNEPTQLWKLDPATGNSTLVYQFDPSQSALVSLGSSNQIVGNSFYFLTQDYSATATTLWKSDGTTAGTEPVTQITTNGLLLNPIYGSANGHFFFIGTTPGTGELQVWSSDGTPQGTGPLTGSLEPASNIVTVGNDVYFAAYESEGNTGFWGLWKSDGTVKGTVLLKNDGTASNPTDLISAGGKLYFVDGDGAMGAQIWTSDGTAKGTVPITHYQGGLSADKLTDVNGTLFFTADDGTHGTELWKLTPSTASSKSSFGLFPPQSFIFFGVPWSSFGKTLASFLQNYLSAESSTNIAIRSQAALTSSTQPSSNAVPLSSSADNSFDSALASLTIDDDTSGLMPPLVDQALLTFSNSRHANFS
jgi:ELWxxDGT repeat protein